jgi:hypothetical protein
MELRRGKKMKKILIMFCVFIFLFIAVSASMADQVQLVYTAASYGKYQTGLGGEFTVKPLDGLEWVLNLYDSKAKDVYPGTFQTFYAGGLETISGYPAKYDALISDKGIYGSQAPGEDPISKGTAWLYYQFKIGQLVGYNFTGTVPQRKDSADKLQKAIWWLEGEKNITYDSSNPFMAAVVTKFGGYDQQGGVAYAMYDNNGQYPVDVLTLWDVGYAGVSGHQHQEKLLCVYEPPTVIPEPATMIFMGVGLLGMAGFLRKKFKK